MRQFIILFIALIASQFIQAQTSLEVTFPVGLSAYTPVTQERLGSPTEYDLKYNYAPSYGVDTRISLATGSIAKILIGFNYLKLQSKANNSFQRESYSWIEKNISSRTAYHVVGGGFAIDIKLYERSRSSFHAFIGIDYLFTIYDEQWTRIERRSYFNSEPETFMSYTPDVPLDPRAYAVPGIGIKYEYAFEPISLLLKLGYSFAEDTEATLSSTKVNWHIFQFSIGASWNSL